ncbi:MAG: L,D-transpeptidase family protein [Methylomicrobium sp.]
MNTRILFALLLFGAFNNVFAVTYTWPDDPNDTVITEHADEFPFTRAEADETLLDIARRFSLGQVEIVRLNQDVDRWSVKKDEVVRLPNRRVLPDTPHEGIVLNIAEYRMYYYPPSQAGMPRTVMSFAHGVGRQDWKTPLGLTKVAKKVKNPSWHPPESIRREHAAMGDPLPAVVPPGPHNPLGAYALHLAVKGEYRIHGTDIDKIYGIGMQITHGCVRMYPEDIEQLYNLVPVGTPVRIVQQQIKVGWLENKLYIEAHPDLEGAETTLEQRYDEALRLIAKANHGQVPEIDEAVLKKALTVLDGDPIAIFERLPAMPDFEEEIGLREASIKSDTPPLPKPSPSGYYQGPPIPKQARAARVY